MIGFLRLLEILEIYGKFAKSPGNCLTVFDRKVVFVGDATDFPRHWFPSSTPLIRNLPPQPGKTTFPVTGLGWLKIRC